MNNNYTLELAATTTDLDAARKLAQTLGGTLYADEREAWQHLPFRGLVTVTTDDLTELAAVADVGLYLICRRLIKPGAANAVGLFPMVGHADLSHQQSDAHWRDNHAPLALIHHPHMTHYTQLSVVRTLQGPEFDGFALCAFASVDDLRNRFYANDESVKVIAEDVKKFANVRKSPRRLITGLEEWGGSLGSE